MRTTNGHERVRLNLALTEAVRNRLEALLRSSEAETMTEVIRRSLAFYEILLDVKKTGGRVILESKAGKREQLRIL